MQRTFIPRFDQFLNGLVSHYEEELVKDYIQQAIQTEAPVTEDLKKRLSDIPRLIHGAVGLATESGELLDALKKFVFYGKPLDRTNLIEEMGDAFWYIAILCDVLGTTFEEVQQININKLRARYPNKFVEYDALNRDLENERRILEAQAALK